MMLFEDVRVIIEFVFDLLPNFSLIFESVEKMLSLMFVVPKFWVFVDYLGYFESVIDF